MISQWPLRILLILIDLSFGLTKVRVEFLDMEFPHCTLKLKGDSVISCSFYFGKIFRNGSKILLQYISFDG